MKVKIFTILTLAIALFLAACGKSDADLQKAATDKLAEDKALASVTVSVKDGVATLNGTVINITDKTKAETAVKGVGAKSVTNNIEVKAPTPAPPPPDPMLQGKIDEALKKAGCTGAKATIANGVITLTGTVPEAKYAACFQAASEVGGMKIDNQLQKSK